MPSPDQTVYRPLADEPWLREASLQAVFAALASAGYEARAVGGAVRNALLGWPITDVDLATAAPPDRTMQAAKVAGLVCYPTGLMHGTVTVVAAGKRFEVTSLRRDVETFGRHARVEFTDDWRADAERRDFTINALYCDAAGHVHDPLGGLGDLQARRIRFIGDPDARIAEDYLRILRFFRFFAQFGVGDPDAHALAACVRGRHGLRALSGERLRGEVLRLVVAPRAPAAIFALVDCGLLSGLTGTAPRPQAFAAIAAFEASAGLQPDAFARLSGLCVAVEEDIEQLVQRFRLSNTQAASLLTVTQRHAEALLGPMVETHARRCLYRLGPEQFRRLVRGLAAFGLPQADLARHHALPERWPVPRFPVGGAEVMALGIDAGPDVGSILTRVEAWWIEADFPEASRVQQHLSDEVRSLIDMRGQKPDEGQA